MRSDTDTLQPGETGAAGAEDLATRVRALEAELALRKRELDALHRISEIALSSLELEHVSHEIAQEVSAATGFPIVVIKRHDEGRRSMVLDAAYGLPAPLTPDDLEVPLDETLSGTVVQTGKTLIEAHVWGRSAHANRTLQRLGVRTLVVVPMTIEQRVVGALTLAHPEAIALDDESLRIAASLGNTVALLTERKRAERALREARDELERRVAERTSELARSNADLRQEIADRKRVQAALEASEAKWRSVVENAPSTIMTLDGEGAIVLSSRGLGLRQVQDLPGARLVDLVRPDQRAELQEALEAVLRRGERRSVEVSVGGQSELRWYAVSLGPIQEAERIEGAVVIASDVTQHRLLEGQLRQSSKMEAIGQLAGGVAHDFNNLLTVINGYSQFMMRRVDPSDPMRRDLEEIRQAGERAAQLTRQLLAFSRRQVLEMRILDVNEVIRGMCSMLGRVLGEDVTLSLHLAEDLGPVKADPGQIEQVIMNLAVNARDAMCDAGTLLVETANTVLDREATDGQVALKPGAYVRLVVGDTGSGMSEEVQAHLFEPFYTTKPAGKGTGLGLATVYGIVRQFGGGIYVYSEAGHGSVFKIYLPRADASVPAEEEDATTPGGAETVLVVEDRPDVRLFTVGALERLGYSVLEAAQAEDALALHAAHEGALQLILTDVLLPEMSGPELVRRLAERGCRARVLFTSGFTEQAIVQQGLLPPAACFIEKPFSVPALARRVRQVLDAPQPPAGV